MREDLLTEIENEYAFQRTRNEMTEAERRENIRRNYPEIEKVLKEREMLVFGTFRNILNGNGGSVSLQERMNELNGRIGTMLKESGLPSDYLFPVYRCSICRDTGYKGNALREPCECLKKAYQEKLRIAVGLDRGQNETFETYDEMLIPNETVNESGITQRQLSRIARDQCEKWADRYPDIKHRDLLISGGSGLGKTFLLRAMANRLIARGENVLIVSAYTFLQMARKYYFDTDNGLQELMTVSVLMIDDLGSEPLMQNITVEQLFNLLNERQSRNLSTIISTNLTLQELRERYTERVASRLNNPRNCLVLTLAGRDLRKLER